MKITTWLVIGMTVAAFTFCGQSFAYEFHIVSEVDAVSDEIGAGYVGSGVSSFTRDYGAPSMVRDNLYDPGQIDYIYIGMSKVHTFEVARTAKTVMNHKSEGRGSWEGGVYPYYPS